MTTEWTVERLNALPVWTVIDYQIAGSHPDLDTALRIQDDLWVGAHSGDLMSSEDILLAGVPRSIRVVSVPVDALLTDDAVCIAAGGHGDLKGHASTAKKRSVRANIRAAIDHVTGGES